MGFCGGRKFALAATTAASLLAAEPCSAFIAPSPITSGAAAANSPMGRRSTLSMVAASPPSTHVTTKSEETFAEAKVCVCVLGARMRVVFKLLGLASYMWLVEIGWKVTRVLTAVDSSESVCGSRDGRQRCSCDDDAGRCCQAAVGRGFLPADVLRVEVFLVCFPRQH